MFRRQLRTGMSIIDTDMMLMLHQVTGICANNNFSCSCRASVLELHWGVSFNQSKVYEVHSNCGFFLVFISTCFTLSASVERWFLPTKNLFLVWWMRSNLLNLKRGPNPVLMDDLHHHAINVNFFFPTVIVCLESFRWVGLVLYGCTISRNKPLKQTLTCLEPVSFYSPKI